LLGKVGYWSFIGGHHILFFFNLLHDITYLIHNGGSKAKEFDLNGHGEHGVLNGGKALK
jgi:hypothetical protein